MKQSLTIILILCILLPASGQSPFNYGQNKDVYFISSALRNKIGIDSIYVVDESSSDMNGNWNVTIISFDSARVSEDWFPVFKDSTFEYNFDSLITDISFLNGSTFELSKGKLKGYGGYGYGAFDWHDIVYASKEVSIVDSHCSGHCGGEDHSSFSKNVFDKKNGNLLYSVAYPTPVANEELNFDELDLVGYNKFLVSGLTAENLPDTTYLEYSNKGLLINKEFQHHKFSENGNFHQCYVGKMKMERFFKKEFGYTPALVLIEIYRYGVFSFTFNRQDKKYYPTDTVILEQ